MGLANTERHYGSLSIGLHWLMLLLMIAVYACIELREMYPRGSDPREALKQWHFMLGLTVFLLVWIRIVVFVTQAMPVITPTPQRWQARSAQGMHILLYLLMVLMPIGGWLILSGEGKEIPYFGLSLPPLIGEDKALAHTIEEVHETVGTAGYFLIALHAGAALYHHYFRKDDTLRRMLP